MPDGSAEAGRQKFAAAVLPPPLEYSRASTIFLSNAHQFSQSRVTARVYEDEQRLPTGRGSNL